MIEPGKYTAQLQEVTFGKTKKNGTPCIVSVWLIEEEDMERSVYTYLSKNAKKISFQKLKNMGFNGDFDNPEFSVETTELICKNDEYEDENGDMKDTERWDFANWGGGANVDDADKKTVKQLNAEWKKDNKDAKAPAKKKTAPAKAKAKKEPEPEPEEEQEVPEEDDDSEAMTPYEQAWDAFVEHKISDEADLALENNQRQKALMEWEGILETVVADKDQDDFEDEDWEAIRLYCVTPF